MTTTEFTRWRLAALRAFFKGRFGIHWHRIVSRHLGHKYQYSAFRYPSRPIRSFYALQKLEDLAIKFGFRPSDPLSQKIRDLALVKLFRHMTPTERLSPGPGDRSVLQSTSTIPPAPCTIAPVLLGF
jgi:hypothetical protein